MWQTLILNLNNNELFVTEEKTAFDAYHVWLGIPPRDQPPHYYRLLGLELYEENGDVIDASANRQSTYLHSMASGPNRRECQKLLNEISAARLCLLNKDSKRLYDLTLKQKLAPKTATKKLPAAKTKNTAWKSYTVIGLILLIIIGGGIYLLNDKIIIGGGIYLLYDKPEQQVTPTEDDYTPEQPPFSFD